MPVELQVTSDLRMKLSPFTPSAKDNNSPSGPNIRISSSSSCFQANLPSLYGTSVSSNNLSNSAKTSASASSTCAIAVAVKFAVAVGTTVAVLVGKGVSVGGRGVAVDSAAFVPQAVKNNTNIIKIIKGKRYFNILKFLL